jgi:hypothetical protein
MSGEPSKPRNLNSRTNPLKSPPTVNDCSTEGVPTIDIGARRFRARMHDTSNPAKAIIAYWD